MSLLERIEKLAAPIAEELSVELVHVEYHKGGSVLRVYIDKSGGVTLEDCSSFSRELSAVLDVEDPIIDSYTLEVSSPGLNRQLYNAVDYQRFAGKRVAVKLFSPLTGNLEDGQKNFKGTLLGYNEGFLKLKVEDGRELKIAENQIAKVNIDEEIK